MFPTIWRESPRDWEERKRSYYEEVHAAAVPTYRAATLVRTAGLCSRYWLSSTCNNSTLGSPAICRREYGISCIPGYRTMDSCGLGPEPGCARLCSRLPVRQLFLHRTEI